MYGLGSGPNTIIIKITMFCWWCQCVCVLAFFLFAFSFAFNWHDFLFESTYIFVCHFVISIRGLRLNPEGYRTVIKFFRGHEIVNIQLWQLNNAQQFDRAVHVRRNLNIYVSHTQTLSITLPLFSCDFLSNQIFATVIHSYRFK